MRTKFIFIGTGVTGTPTLKCLLQDPGLELVGWWVTSPEKEGMDAGTFCGLPPVGVKGSRSIDKMLALKADCLFYAGHTIRREMEACREMCRFLESGTNVVTFTLISMIYPPAGPTDLRNMLEAACQKGKTTFYASGSEPGFLTLPLPAALLSPAGRVDHYRELMFVPNMISTYPVEHILRDSMGFGQVVGTTPLRYREPTAMDWWKPNIHVIADLFGVKVEDFTFKLETGPTPRDIESSVGLFKKGSIGSFRWELNGIVGGKPAITVEYVALLQPDIPMADHWTRAAPDTKDSAIVYIITGDPSYKNQIYLDTPPGGANASLAMTGMHLGNAIPLVVKHAPGVISAFDLPYYGPRNVSFRPK